LRIMVFLGVEVGMTGFSSGLQRAPDRHA
jgi:hypothetical protein